jgi:hypothetical protein
MASARHLQGICKAPPKVRIAERLNLRSVHSGILACWHSVVLACWHAGMLAWCCLLPLHGKLHSAEHDFAWQLHSADR